jgi:thioredoxin reductase (NADPH)
MAGDEAYPIFGGVALHNLRPYGAERPMSLGDVLFSPDHESYDLIVVLDGQVDIRDESQGRDALLYRHEPGSFVGELNLLTGQRPFLTARAAADGRVLVIPADQLRELLSREGEVADALVTAMIARRRLRLRDSHDATIEVLGTSESEQALALRTFLNRNTVWYRWVDVDAEPDELATVGATRDDLPVVVTPVDVLRRCDPGHLADALGLSHRPDDTRHYDVVVVGSGPAGLAAAVYGASEGLTVAVFDKTGPGGQAGGSSRIENYLGFPDGISGGELTSRAMIQAQRFGALLNSPCRIAAVRETGDGFTVTLADDTTVITRTVVVATGAQYRRLPLDNWQRLEGAGIYYAATDLEAGLCVGRPAVVLGGGNSAGQAALYLARHCTRVTIVIRRATLAESMSDYLIERIDAHPLISVASSTVITAVDGGDHLRTVALRGADGDVTATPAHGLFCFIGALPATGWLPPAVARDDDGFVLTDVAVPPAPGRTRLPFETALDGVFAAGDVRLGSMKRVAAAVGEGSSVIRSVHQYLASLSGRDAATEPSQGEHAPIPAA